MRLRQQLNRPGMAASVLIACCVVAGACGTTGPSAPRYEGQWSGTTAQGQPISFTISADEKVTAISVGYNFNGCSGSQTFTSLNLEIAPMVTCIPAPCPAGLTSFRAFNYSARAADGSATTVNGLFPTTSTAQGSVGFAEFPACGTLFGVGWTASRR